MFISKDAVISIGDTQITGKNCIVTDLTINNPEPQYVSTLGSRKVIPMPSFEPFTITIEMKCIELDYVALFGGGVKKISKKNVEDCTTSELLFAIREKVKMGER